MRLNNEKLRLPYILIFYAFISIYGLPTISGSVLDPTRNVDAEQLPLPLDINSRELSKIFKRPPDSARAWVYWYWMNGNISREGLTADLEAMKRVGIHGALILEGDLTVPEGPVKFLSGEWRELFQHVLKEAARLGMQVSMNNAAGWAGSGGPWITPELSMQKLVNTRLRVEGGKPFDGVLEQPTVIKDHYRDIVVLAYPTSPGDPQPAKISASTYRPMDHDDHVPYKLQDGLVETCWRSYRWDKPPSREQPEFVQFDYPTPFTASALYLLPAKAWGPKEIEVQISDDGKTYRTIARATMAQDQELRLPFGESIARHFRVLITSSYPANNVNTCVQIAEMALLKQTELEDYKPSEALLSLPTRAMDLTSKMELSGRLRWDPPVGTWDIFRIGHTSTGKENSAVCAPKIGAGLECDKLSQKAIEVHFEGMLAKLVADAGPLAGKVLSSTHIDSWEVGTQNWTPKFREEFQRLRGYDPLPFLPGIFGRIIGDLTTHRRFLWDMRMTINDLLVDNYAGQLKKLSAQHGLALSIEAYREPAIDLVYAGRSDLPQGEFWIKNQWNYLHVCRLMASAGHLYGKQVVAAEAFTAEGESAKWTEHPATMKALGDWAFCEGINRFVIHTYVHQPRLDLSPGLTLAQYGTHYNRNMTWWEQSQGWHDYLARCQVVLQSGLPAADICYLDEEDSPRRAPLPQRIEGYDFDISPAEVLLTRMTTKGNKVVLPEGLSYSLLVLPATEKMTPLTLRKIIELVEAGASVAFTHLPTQSPSLENYPACDREIQVLARKLTEARASKIGHSRLGKGNVYFGSDQNTVVSSALKAQKVPPALLFKNAAGGSDLKWIQRNTKDAVYYFMANLKEREEVFTASFRRNEGPPKLWLPQSGEMRELPEFTQAQNGRVELSLKLDPCESVFVVFSKENLKTTASTKTNLPVWTSLTEISGPWQLQFDPQWGGPQNSVTMNELSDWAQSPENGIKYYSGPAVYLTSFKAKKPAGKSYLDLGRVEVSARVRLNGIDCGLAWKAPYRLEITEALRNGQNNLVVEVVNLWANRCIGDEQLPEDSERKGTFQTLNKWPQWLVEGQPNPSGRFTFATVRYYQKDSPLLPSGLFGPVRLMTTK